MVETVWSQTTVMNPATQLEVVSKSDTVDLTNIARALFVGGAGNVAFVLLDDTAVTMTGIVAGSVIPIVFKRINSTNTTATNMAAMS